MIKHLQLELAFETLPVGITISFRPKAFEKSLDTLTKARFTVKGNHFVF